ncbi:TPA: AIDA repeat-containing protein, partial [Escherichia coli]
MENGTQYVESGGTAENTTINKGGEQYVESGGTATGTTIYDGGRQYVSGTATDTTIYDGGYQGVSGTATDTTINDGGTLRVNSGGNATGVDQKKGAALIATTATGTVVKGQNENGEFSIENGQAEKVLLENGGYLVVVNGTTANNTTIYAGGTLSVNSGGNATGVDQKKGAALLATTATGTVVKGQNENGEFSIENGQAEKVLLENGGWLIVKYGTTANNTTIRKDGGQTVESGGTATDTTINAGGTLRVDWGG